MPHNPLFIQKRNEHIKQRFRYHRKKNPKWTLIAVIETVAEEVWLSPASVSKVLRKDDPKIPDVKTIRKYSTAYLTA
jgi:hypothetical protein